MARVVKFLGCNHPVYIPVNPNIKMDQTKTIKQFPCVDIEFELSNTILKQLNNFDKDVEFKIFIKREVKQRKFKDSEGNKVYQNNYDNLLLISGLVNSQYKLFWRFQVDNFDEEALEKIQIDITDFSISTKYIEKPKMIVFSPIASAGLFHELIGHLREADISNNYKYFSIKNPNLSLYNNPLTESNYRSCFKIDEDGVKASKVCLVENGHFKHLLHNINTASIYNTKSNGNGLSAELEGDTAPRQSCLEVSPVNGTEKGFIKSVNNGLYINGHLTGQFLQDRIIINTKLAYIIVNGRLVKPVNNITLEYKIEDLLSSIIEIGQDIKAINTYTCNKFEQSISVDFKVPSLLIGEG